MKRARRAETDGSIIALNQNKRTHSRPEPSAGLRVEVFKDRSVADKIPLQRHRCPREAYVVGRDA